MLVSVFTPTHNPKYLESTYNSLKKQTYKDWEWVVVPNGCNLDDCKYLNKDNRIRIIPYNETGNIGAVKRFACDNCKGELFVELDHDDELTSNALERIVEEYKELNTDDAFLYSDCANFIDGSRKPFLYDPAYGWDGYDFEYEDEHYFVMKSFELTPRMLCHIFFAPNHVRVWSREAYLKAGGHDTTIKIGDDHDLVCRTYISGSKFKYIDACLYLYRVYAGNTHKSNNAHIMIQNELNLNKYLHSLIKRWSKDKGLINLDLGSAFNKPEGFVGLDINAGEGVDIVCDIMNGIPLKDNSVGCVRAVNFLEHLPPKGSIKAFNEIYRVLAPDGIFTSMTPSAEGGGWGAFGDPTHTDFYTLNRFWYFTDKNYSRFVPAITCRFQKIRLFNRFPDQFCIENKLMFIYADLLALKGQRVAGLCLI